METQPSLDANAAFRIPKDASPSGADSVAKELDEFNARYQYLLDALYARLHEIASKCPGDIVTLVSFYYIYTLFIISNTECFTLVVNIMLYC